MANVNVRFHDLRHTLITKLAESGAGDETIMAIVGHVSRRTELVNKLETPALRI